MKKTILFSLLMLALFVAACSGENNMNNNENNLANTQDEASQTNTADTNNDGANDVQITTTGNSAEVIVDLDEIQTQNIPAIENYCVPGTTYTYASSEGNSDSTIIGLESYKGKTWCRAESTTEIDSPIGKIVTDTTYYFDNTYKEYWIQTVTNVPGTASQTNEVHLVDGEVQ
ncbi:MAG: hypothetical protein ACP5N2_06145 [Candidatus Nanoarchaeia archaeon]